MNESLEKIYFYLTNVLKQKSTFPLNKKMHIQTENDHRQEN